MRHDKTNSSKSPIDLASVVRGLYGRVARQLDLDPSYVSRVARGERQSEDVEAAIGLEIRRIMKRVGSADHNGNHLNGNNHRNGKANKTAKSNGRKVSH